MRRRALLAAAFALAPAISMAGEAKKEGKDAKVDTYLPIQVLNTSVTNAYGDRTVLSVGVGLDIPDPSLNEKATLLIPRLRSAYGDALLTFGAALRPGAAPDADALARRLQQITDQVLGKPGARLLLASVVVN